jgi:glucose-1-phosphate cytidylyltransferase
MVEFCERPFLYHVMCHYAAFGFNDFYVACGYRGEVIKKYFADFCYHAQDLIVSLKSGDVEMVGGAPPDWRVHAIDTGRDAMTGGRLLALRDYVGDGPFMCTYGDGLSSVALDQLVAFHRSHGKLATVTAVHPPARFGLLKLEGDHVAAFSEKPQTDTDWINGGFFVFEPEILDYIEGPESSLEKDVLERIAADGQLQAFRHSGFFQPMDTLREKQLLEELWQSGNPPWVCKP